MMKKALSLFITIAILASAMSGMVAYAADEDVTLSGGDPTLGRLIGDVSRGNHKDAGLANTPIIVPRPTASKYEAVKVLDTSGVVLSDIDGHWASGSIRDFVAKGYISGYPDGTFKPDDTITYAELAAIIARMGFRPTKFSGGIGEYPDVKHTYQTMFKDWSRLYAQGKLTSEWFYTPMLIATEAGFFGNKAQCTENQKANINDAVQRQYAAMFMYNLLDVTSIADTDISFSDMDKIDRTTQGYINTKFVDEPEYVPDRIKKIISAGIIQGYPDNTFAPTATITRAEMVVMLTRILDLYGNDTLAISDNLYGNYWRFHWQQEDELLRLTNEERAKQGAPALVRSESLTAYARIKAIDAQTVGYSGADMHTSITYGGAQQAAKKFGITLRAENAALGATSSVFGLYTASQGHYKNYINKSFNWWGTGFSDEYNYEIF